MSATVTTRNIQFTNLLTGWTNDVSFPYDTFTSVGKDITSAISSGDSEEPGLAATNEVNITIGGNLRFICNVTLNSGTLPYVNLYRNGSMVGGGQVSAGENRLDYNITQTADYSIGFWVYETATDFSAVCTMWAENG